MGAIIIHCGEPERAGSHHDTRRAVAPGRRPEGRGRKPYSRRAERGHPLRVVYGDFPVVSVSSGLRESRDDLNVTARPVQLTANFCGDLRRWSFPPRIKPSKQSRGVFTVFLRPAPSVRVALHKRQSNQGWTACLTKGFPKSVKEFPRTI